MQNLVITETKSSLGVEFDTDSSTFKLYGSSYISDVHDFFVPIIEWLDVYIAKLNETKDIHVKLAFQYLNSTSSRCVLVLLRRVQEIGGGKVQLKVEWEYDKDNEDTLEAGKDFEFALDVPFTFKPS
jgi:hypothetical protein